MPLKNFYDVIVVGTHPAGLMAAGLLGRRHYRVLVLGQGGSGTSYQHEGMEIPAMPSLLPPYDHAPVLDQVLNTLGAEDPVHVLGMGGDTPLQVVTPDQRVDLTHDRKRLEIELERAFPTQSQEVLRLFDSLCSVDERLVQFLKDNPSLPPAGMRERTRIKRLGLSSQSTEVPDPSRWPPLMKILAAATAFLSNLEEQARPAYVTGHLILDLLRGLRTVSNWPDLLLDTLAKIGVEVDLKTVVEEFLFEGKNLGGVRILRGSNSYNCGTLITSMPISEAMELIPLRKRHRRFLLEANSVQPSLSLFVTNLLVPEECLPLGMGSHLLLVRRTEEPLEEDNLLRVHCLPCLQRPGRVLVSLSCLVPYRKHTVGWEYLGPLQERVLAAAAWLIPFLDNHLEGQSCPFGEARAGYAGCPSPWALHQVFETEQEVFLGSAVLPLHTPYRNLFYCGPEAVPGLGIEGAAFAATQAARLVGEKMKLKKIL